MRTASSRVEILPERPDPSRFAASRFSLDRSRKCHLEGECRAAQKRRVITESHEWRTDGSLRCASVAL